MDLLRLRVARRRLQAQRKALLLELGEAAYRGDEARSAELRAQLEDVDAVVARCRQKAEAATRWAQRQVRRRREAIEATRRLR
jgi:hypothetical protein